MVDNRGSKIISCAHKYHKSIVNIVVKTKKYKASCFLERQCLTIGEAISSIAHMNIIK